MEMDTHNNQSVYQCHGFPGKPCGALFYGDDIPIAGVGENREPYCRCCNSRDLKVVEEVEK